LFSHNDLSSTAIFSNLIAGTASTLANFNPTVGFNKSIYTCEIHELRSASDTYKSSSFLKYKLGAAVLDVLLLVILNDDPPIVVADQLKAFLK